MIKIDGSHGEGGGQIVRTALALSTALQEQFEVDRIRQGRNQPGLKAQHLTCLKALKQLCNAEFSKADIGSEKLRYSPGEIKARKVDVDIGTAGSITLLMQSLLVPCFLAKHPITLKITGGTSGKWQMPFDYFNNVFLPHLNKYAEISAALLKRGYYPKGGGVVEVKIRPKYCLETRHEAPEINLADRGRIAHIKGISHASKSLQNANVAERQADAARAGLAGLGCSIDIRTEYCDTLSPGSGITLWALFEGRKMDGSGSAILGSDVIGEKGKPSENVGSSAARKLISEIETNAAVDRHLADNLVPFLALFGGKIRTSEITEHTKTNIYASEKFLGKRFEINEKENLITALGN